MISRENLKEYIRLIDESIKWDNSELEKLSNSFDLIYKAVACEIYADVEISDDLRDEYAISIIENALLKVLNSYAKAIKIKNKEKYYITSRKPTSKFDFIRTCEYVDKIDLNKASAKELEAAEGLGKTIAERIVKKRIQYGYFKSIEELLKIKGIGEKNFPKIAYSLYISNPEEVCFYHPALVEFKNNSGLANYFKLLKHTGGSFSSDFATDMNAYSELDYKRKVVDEIAKISESISSKYSQKIRKMITAGKIKELISSKDNHKMIIDSTVSDIKGVTILEDSDYYYFLDKILDKAKTRIFITMFLMYTNKEKKSSTMLLLNKLIAAKNRGVDVKVILDSDKINCNTHEILKGNGINAVYDTREIKTHTKMVIIDNEHLIIGSHNWTSGSFYQYDDKSIYIESESLVAKSMKEFELQWAKY